MEEENSDVGAELRGKREGLFMTQAEVAEAVGTTQQTVARIERGETTHSRFIGKIRSYLDGRIGGKSAPLSPSVVQTYNLSRDGEIDAAIGVRTQLHFADTAASVYVIHVMAGVRGPIGDLIFRPGDQLVVDPQVTPRHFDWCLFRESEVRGRIQLYVDPAEMPPQMSVEQLREWGYAVAGSEGQQKFHKIVARYIA